MGKHVSYLPERRVARVACAPWRWQQGTGHDGVAANGLFVPHASQCARVKLRSNGFGAHFHRIVQATLFAKKLGVRLVPHLLPTLDTIGLQERFGERVVSGHACNASLLSCLFQLPLDSQCQSRSYVDISRHLPRDPTYKHPPAVPNGTTFHAVASAVAAVLEPTAELQAYLARLLPPSPPPCIAVQLRYGDSCIPGAFRKDSKVCDNVSSYVNATVRLAEHYQLSHVVIASDSSRAKRKFAAALPTTLRIVTPVEDTETLFGDELYASSTTIEHVLQRSASNASAAFESFLLDVYAMAACHAFVGKLTSHVARLALELMSARRGHLVPFISLDAPWCFGGLGSTPHGRGSFLCM